VSHTISWNGLNSASLIFGKTFDTNYKLRSLSAGSSKIDAPLGGSPTTNEWDSILTKNGLTEPIKNWKNVLSWGQDTGSTHNRTHTLRGYIFAADGYRYDDTKTEAYTAWRPALEVLNPTALTADGLKAVTLNLNGGSFNSKTDALNIVCAGDSFKAPSATGLTRPTGNNGTKVVWNTTQDGSGTPYAVGAAVPNSVTTLYAQWIPLPPATLGVAYEVAGGTGSRLERSLNTVVTNTNEGITAADKANGNNVTLKLTVAEKTAAGTADSDKIEGVKQGDTVQYYDVTVKKIVTTPEGTSTPTVLTSIPKPVQAVIPVPAAIQGKTSYTVYRIHGGVADKIPNDPAAPEFYTVNPGGTSLTLHVSKFSTYAVITGGKSLTGDVTFGDVNNPKRSDMDVQGKVLEGMFGVYKLDISWGAMKFDYNAQGKVWNPATHVYDIVPGAAGWTKESFEAGNNKITVANHSNGDVWLSYLAKPDAVLAGATMTVRATNSLASIEAKDILLAKVAAENGTAPTVDTFVWLTGEPTSLTSKTYTKAGVITITAEPDTAGGLTPKNTTP
ncbi:MAG: hypothetical protein RR450_08155, partial [Oscillospiraceae bacterium]